MEGKSERRRTRTYNALFLVAARFKGKRTLLDISIRGEYAVSQKGERKREAEGRVGQGEWLFLREGAGKRLRDGIGIREEKQEDEEEEEGGGSVGEEGGSNRVACNFEMDSAPPSSLSPFVLLQSDPPCGFSSFSSSSFLSSHETRRVDQLRSRRLLHVTEEEDKGEKKRERKREKMRGTNRMLLNWMEKP